MRRCASSYSNELRKELPYPRAAAQRNWHMTGGPSPNGNHAGAQNSER